MIDISRKDSTVIVSVTGRHPVAGTTWGFSWQCNGEQYAALLAENLRYHLHDELERIRREAYEKGCEEARRRKGAKRNWFSNAWKGAW